MLSKSRLNAYHQCRKRLWLEVHRPDLRVDTATARQMFGAGHKVGELARSEHPDGILIGPADPAARIDWNCVFAETAAAMQQSPRRPIFEATFRHSGVLVRADLLLPEGDGWHMAEVKSSSGVKAYHLKDVAAQAWVLRGAGVDLRSVELRHVDNQFVYPGQERYEGLFRAGDVQKQVDELQCQVPEWVADATGVVAAGEPTMAMGAHCKKPFECPFAAYCASIAQPSPRYPVTILPGNDGKALARRLAAEGFTDLCDVPGERLKTSLQAVIHEASRTGEPKFDADGARRVLAEVDYPRYFFDFETVDFVVPVWVGTRPFEKLPFQWSCHVERTPGCFEHWEFLDLTGDNPARACAESLLSALGDRGPIIAYHASFERQILDLLATRFEDLREGLNSCRQRVIDLEDVVRKHYYHPAMLGSFSIKKVLPTIAPDLDHAKLGEVQDGKAAQFAYLEAIAPETELDRRASIRTNLLNYCRRDTWAMAALAWFLEGRGLPPDEEVGIGIGNAVG